MDLKTCDIVMKGGVTSGIVYPKAIYQIAKNYRFVNIGGTSAGAIAAVLTAAAEYRRRSDGSFDGFSSLNALPSLLGKKEHLTKRSKLFSLFKANKSTENVFKFAIGIMDAKGLPGRILSFIRFLIGNCSSLFITIVAALIISCFTFVFLFKDSGIYIPWILFSILFYLLLFFCVAAWKSFKDINEKLSGNHFGLTTGYYEKNEKLPEPLTTWLANKIENTAGRNIDGPPLTFGDLEEGEYPINLQMVSSNLTLGKPYTLPFKFSKADNKFFFIPNELSLYFPPHIINWMKEKGGPLISGINKKVGPGNNEKDNSARYWKLPKSEDMPVIVAARMSLSFPVLFSAVPLHAVDYSLKINSGKKPEVASKEKCLFSDGGICSNFPVHFFDSTLPRRPTFAINLRDYPPDRDENLYMPKSNAGGITDDWNRFNNSIFSYMMSIFKTMQNWNDNTQLKVPGYRDRVVNIHLRENEGGLNLDMDERTIRVVSSKGKYAGIKIRDRFLGKDGKMDWNNQRWIRLRITMCLLEKYIKEIETALGTGIDLPYENSYEKLIDRPRGTHPTGYYMNKKDILFALRSLPKIKSYIRYMNKNKISMFNAKTPEPMPELKIKPKI